MQSKIEDISKIIKEQIRNYGKKIEEDQRHHYVGPTKAALNLVYTF